MARRSTTPANLGDLVAAKAQLADAATRVADLRSSALKLEILVEDTRPDDRDIAERVGLALDKLGIGWTITAVTAQVLRDRVKRGQCDLWIGQLAEPVASPAIWWSAAFAAGNDDSAIAPLQQGADLGRARALVRGSRADRAADVPLVAAVASHRSQGPRARCDGPAVLRRRVPVRLARPRAPVKLRGRFTLTLALAALVPITIAAVVTTQA